MNAPDAEPQTPEPAPTPDPPTPSVWRRVRRDVAAAIVGAAVAGIGAAVGVAHISWFWLLAMCALLAGLGISIDHAMRAPEADVKALWWRMSTAVALMIPIGGFVYHEAFDPSMQTPETYQFVANGGDVNIIPLYGEAGGNPQTIETGGLGQNGLIGGQTYEFDCWVSVGKNPQIWLRYHRFGGLWWAPRDDLHSPAGLQQAQVPHC
jgi:hypothetical protein